VESSKIKCVLVVANRTASTQRLLDEISRRAEREPTRFTLLIPDAPNRKAADWTLEVAIPLLRRAARGPVDHLVGGPDPFIAVQKRRARARFRRDHHLDTAQANVEVVAARPHPPRREPGASGHGSDPSTRQGRPRRSRHRAGHRPEWRYSVTYAGAPMAITRANSARTASTRSVSPPSTTDCSSCASCSNRTATTIVSLIAYASSLADSRP
jgi:hypothetical protein